MTGNGRNSGSRAPQRQEVVAAIEAKAPVATVVGALIVIVIALGGIGVALSMTTPEVTQPLPFNHVLHLEEVGLECTDCHLYVTSGERTVIPNIQGCADCHFEPITESEIEAELIEYITTQQPIPWKQVYWLPDHVYFSHRRHTAAAEIDCETCHGPVPQRTEPLSRRLVPIDMDDCMDCHYRSGASNDCINCHR